MRHLRTLKFPARITPQQPLACVARTAGAARKAEQSRWNREQKGKPPAERQWRLAWIAGLEVRYLPGEQNPVHLGRCQYFLAIELFSSGTKGLIDGIDACQARCDGWQHLLF